MLNDSEIQDALRQVIDPDIGVNIVDLGLVERIQIDEASIQVDMIMTTPACPQSAYLQDEVERVVRAAAQGPIQVIVSVLDSPFWEPARMSDSAKKIMGWPG
ncbi:metal-sulfur cluster biosynthetic protein [Paramagnetospirillum kuznetsovii]|uniref:Metal-sulfur cluster biosynthetic protein n=1 Tax=Paramagnetospirillum kuznetsovii TaxID=2053833 RepID=A0A364NYU3_9PROT|nr:metal-sulfur cluster assembly factor [Paramagnetospirillum kuznetsovii]RAU22236.1 metal-sulfur cluster biosynthetic protein [Paramagnetospirillum kuznetsovii]